MILGLIFPTEFSVTWRDSLGTAGTRSKVYSYESLTPNYPIRLFVDKYEILDKFKGPA